MKKNVYGKDFSNSLVLSKWDFLMTKNGTITVKILGRLRGRQRENFDVFGHTLRPHTYRLAAMGLKATAWHSRVGLGSASVSSCTLPQGHFISVMDGCGSGGTRGRAAVSALAIFCFTKVIVFAGNVERFKVPASFLLSPLPLWFSLLLVCLPFFLIFFLCSVSQSNEKTGKRQH